jgi:hypothetical protein
MNKANFFTKIRTSIFKGRLSQKQVDGINNLLDIWMLNFKQHPVEYLAYCLATAYHETGGTMQPVREAFGTSTADSIKKLNAAYAAGKMKSVKTPYWRTGFFGRGYVQLTHEANYKKASQKLGVDFWRYPDKVMEPNHAAMILFKGCLEGWFTGKKLADYIKANPGPGNDEYGFMEARRVVNGTDKARLIAGYAAAFDAALYLSWKGVDTKPSKPAIQTLITGEKPLESPINLGAAGQAALTASTAIAALDWRVAALVVVVGAAFAVWIIRERGKIKAEAGI